MEYLINDISCNIVDNVTRLPYLMTLDEDLGDFITNTALAVATAKVKNKTRRMETYPSPRVVFLVTANVPKIRRKSVEFLPPEINGLNYISYIERNVAPALKQWLFMTQNFPPVHGGIESASLKACSVRLRDTIKKAASIRGAWPIIKNAHRGYVPLITDWNTEFLSNKSVIGVVKLNL